MVFLQEEYKYELTGHVEAGGGVKRLRLVGVGGGAGEQGVEVTSGQVRHRNPANCLPRGRPGSKSTHKLEPRNKKSGEDHTLLASACCA
jgi:hypothetical protein